MSSVRSLLLYLIVPITVIGCEDPMASISDDVVLIPTAALYAPGETVSAHLFNRSEQGIEYTTSLVRLEHLEGVRWVLIGEEPQPSGLLELFSLEAAGTTMLSMPLDAQLETGRYRIRFGFVPEGTTPLRFIYSPTFEVQAGD
jgi:hypothetical protein